MHVRAALATITDAGRATLGSARAATAGNTMTEMTPIVMSDRSHLRRALAGDMSPAAMFPLWIGAERQRGVDALDEIVR